MNVSNCESVELCQPLKNVVLLFLYDWFESLGLAQDLQIAELQTP